MEKKIVYISFIPLLISFYLLYTNYFFFLYSVFDITNKATTVNKNENNKSGEKLFSVEELKLYNGISKPLLYLAILGNIFDVTKAEQHYGPEGPYNFFVGHDAARNFITGKFNKEDLSDDVNGLTYDELRSLKNWLKFYSTEYTKVGKLIGKYYNNNGQPTSYSLEVNKLFVRAEEAKENEKLDKQKFPPCNVEWDPVKGSRVWCTLRSGGIERTWAGRPRQYYEVGSSNFRCACVSDGEIDHIGSIKEYDGCDSNSESCFVKNP